MSHHLAPNQPTSRKKITTHTLKVCKKQSKPISMITAYDYTSAILVDRAKIDMILVGDSLGMVLLGQESTVSVTMEEMLIHCRSVTRGAEYAFVVGDMPFLSYNVAIPEAIQNAGRFFKEANVDAIKLEGGVQMANTVQAITNAGMAVVGHIGFTPQSVAQLGGYRIQGKDAESAVSLYKDAIALQEAGAIAIVLEMVPAKVAEAISQALDIPTIGIGAGVGCDGQVLVFHDLLGIQDDVKPKFLKQYANLGEQIEQAVATYVDEVQSRAFPAEEHTYSINDEAYQSFLERIAQ